MNSEDNYMEVIGATNCRWTTKIEAMTIKFATFALKIRTFLGGSTMHWISTAPTETDFWTEIV